MRPQLQLEIVTPERIVVQVFAQEVIVPAHDGMRGILPDHEPMITTLRTGELKYFVEGRPTTMAVSEGLLEVAANKVNILVERAQKPEEIDTEHYQELLQTTTAKLAKAGDKDMDYDKLQQQLEEAELHLRLAKSK